MYIPPAIFEYYTTDLDEFQFFREKIFRRIKKNIFLKNRVTIE